MKLAARALMALSLAAAACGSGSTSSDGPGMAQAEQADTTGTPAERFDKLVALLKETGALVIPPDGKAHLANEVTATVDAHMFDGDLRKALADAATPLYDRFGVQDRSAGILSFTQDPDTHLTIQFGFDDAATQRYLVDSVDASRQRAVKSLLKGLDASWARLGVYNAASEVVGDDILLVQPFAVKDKVLVIHLGYVEA